MVTAQQHQQTIPDGNQFLKDQDQISSISAVDHDTEGCADIVHSAKNTAVSVTGNGSLTGSSTQCSNIDDDDEEDETDVEEGDWVPDLPVPVVYQQHQQVTTADGNVVLPNADVSNFGDVRVKNSANVHLGNKTFYKGPVTIKQFVYTNTASIPESDTAESDNVRASDVHISDLSTIKGDSTANNSILSKNPDLDNGNIFRSLFSVGGICSGSYRMVLWGYVKPTVTVVESVRFLRRGFFRVAIENKSAICAPLSTEIFHFHDN